MKIRTKIICTIGPSVATLESILQLINAGMDVARLNFSHGTHEEHLKTIQTLKQARAITNKSVAIMIDTKGPEIRIGKVVQGGVAVQVGSRLLLVRDKELEGNATKISIRPSVVLDYLTPGITLLIDNGYIQAKVVDISPDGATIEFINSGVILSSKGVNIPGVAVPLPALTEKDMLDIEFGCREKVDVIAASFIRNAQNILAIKKLTAQFSHPDILVIAKIENSEGIHNFDDILHVADGIMVARGDLGVEIPLSQVPRLQKMMIRKCNLVGKPAVTATQMLESMIQNPRPTRAEVSDVANAIYDGTSSVMLSGETAVGKYPFDTVHIMGSIVQEAENDFNYDAFFDMHAKLRYSDVASALTLASVKTASSLEAKAIFIFTRSGTTARLISRLKPTMPIIALTPNELTFHQLALCWGVVPVLCKEPCTNIDGAFCWASKYGVQSGIMCYGDIVVLTAGSPLWVAGTSNTMLVDSIGDILVEGEKGFGNMCCGTTTRILDDCCFSLVSGSILILTKYDDTYLPLIRQACGVILYAEPGDTTSSGRILDICQKENKSAIVATTGPLHSSCLLQDGQTVVLDPQRAIVYKAVS